MGVNKQPKFGIGEFFFVVLFISGMVMVLLGARTGYRQMNDRLQQQHDSYSAAVKSAYQDGFNAARMNLPPQVNPHPQNRSEEDADMWESWQRGYTAGSLYMPPPRQDVY